jgi:hypothetical protein
LSEVELAQVLDVPGFARLIGVEQSSIWAVNS